MNLMKQHIALITLLSTLCCSDIFSVTELKSLNSYNSTVPTFFAKSSNSGPRLHGDRAVWRILDCKRSIIEEYLKSSQECDQSLKNKLLEAACFFQPLHKYIGALIKRGADIYVQREGKTTLLHSAVYLRQVKLIKILLKAHMNPNVVDKKRSTPLQKLASEDFLFLLGNVDHLKRIVCLLLKYGANPYLTNNDGKTPIDLMREKGFGELAQIMENYIKIKQLDYKTLNSIFENLNQQVNVKIDDID